jgi:cell division protein FtsI/penicillin-binding protein 2
MEHLRINIIFILILICGAAIIGRLFYIQVLNEDFYKALAHGQQKIFSLSHGERGEIFFKDNEILATNVSVKYAFISPREITGQEKTAEIISRELNLDKQWVLEKIRKDSLFEPIKQNLSDEEIDTLEQMDIQGFYLGEESKRKYPYNFLASQVVGFVSEDNIGQYGIEEYWDNALKGEDEVADKWVKNKKGSDIILTIDYNIQYLAEKLLKQASEQLNIEGGSIIVIDPMTGKILCLANFPGFNPNTYFEETDFKIFKNSAIQELFEPGSVFKAITMAAALQEGKVTPQTTYIDKGSIKIKSDVIYNYDDRVWGERTMTEVLERSINTGAVFVETQIGHNIFLDYIEKFGIFENTGIDLPYEASSTNEELKKGYEIGFATASFGQGIAMTPIQLVRAFSVIANGGKLITPHLVNLTESQQYENGSRTVISDKTASQLTAMLVSVVENGFAKKAKVPGYYIAGKTGTAQVSWSALDIDKRGYSDKTIQSFIGFAPAFNPEFLILVKLDNPATKTAEYSAMPIFQELAKYIIDYYQIPPDHE